MAVQGSLRFGIAEKGFRAGSSGLFIGSGKSRYRVTKVIAAGEAGF